jgi:NAD(P)-dependent dehydrogenase (short-subunit alcohol dehydrogenase family)
MLNADCYEGRRVVVSGCASGIGAATARALVECGAVVLGLDRHEPDVGVAEFVPVDLGDRAAIEAAAAEVGGRIHALFNCAGLAPTQAPLDILTVNFLGTRELTRRLADRMGAGAAIVSVSSNGGLTWRDHQPLLREWLGTPDFDGGLRWIESRVDDVGNAYRFAKEAITVWTLLESARLIARGIRINCTSPGAVDTPMLAEVERHLSRDKIDPITVPIGRRASPEEQTWPLLFLNSDAASYINGADLPVDGGYAAMAALGGAG